MVFILLVLAMASRPAFERGINQQTYHPLSAQIDKNVFILKARAKPYVHIFSENP